MQVVGTSLLLPAVKEVAARATRDEVRAWAERVIFRHIKRTPALMAAVDTRRKLDQVLSAEALPADAVERIISAFEGGEKFFAPGAALVTRFLATASDTMDFVCSLPAHDRRVKRIERMSWTDAEIMSASWHEALARAGKKSRNLIAGTERVMELDAGVHVSELLTAKALKAEGGAMGHCVGGYWDRVSSGETRIHSIRDANGLPHVTIELGRSPQLKLPDGSFVSIDRSPAPGKSEVAEVASGWRAVQVRGKSNNPPVERWKKYLDRYLDASAMVWTEFGRLVRGEVGGRTLTVYRAGRAMGLEPDVVAANAEDEVLGLVRKQRGEFASLYRKSGLEAVHADCSDKGRLASWAELLLPIVMGGVGEHMARGAPFSNAVSRSGLLSVLRLLDNGSRSAVEVRRAILDMAVSADVQKHEVTSRVLVGIPGQQSLMHHRHSLPLMTVALLSAGALAGFEDDVAELVRPSLGAALSHARKNPQDIHSLVAGIGGIDARGVVEAFLLCGLGAEYAAAKAAVEQGVRRKVKDLLLAAKRERSRAGCNVASLNLLGNVLAEGYEDRLVGLVRSSDRTGLLLAPARVVSTPARVATVEQPLLKKYRLPGR